MDGSPHIRRALLAAGTAAYKFREAFSGDGLSNLDGVPEELSSVVNTLSDLGYAPQSSSQDKPFLLNPEVNDLVNAIYAVTEAAPVIIVYYTGHGLKPVRSPFYLLTADSREDRLDATALAPSRFPTLFHRLEQGRPAAVQPQVLVILDCCFSEAGAMTALKASLEDLGNPNVWILASAGSEQWAQEGVFVSAFTSALGKAAIDRTSQEFMHPDEIQREINKALTDAHADQNVTLIHPRGLSSGPPPPFFPNPNFVPGVNGRPVQEQVWISRLRGAPEATPITAFYVTGSTGRVRAVQDIAAWMRDPKQKMGVVTGSPGSGKTTILALPILLSNAENSTALLAASPNVSLITTAAVQFSDLNVIGVYARGMNPYQTTDLIAEQLGRRADTPAELLEDLAERPEQRQRILVVDALDEARDPTRLVKDLVLPLARSPNIKVLLGGRRHVLPSPTAADLLIDLDTAKYRDPLALRDYVRKLLLATQEPGVYTPYRDEEEGITDAVAHAIASRATAAFTPDLQAESFLLAQLIAKAIRNRKDVLAVPGPHWANQLPSSIGAAFQEDLSQLQRRKPVSLPLLKALAWSKGPGLPWGNIWPAVARALAETEGQPTHSCEDSDVKWLLDNAGGYIAEDLGPGRRSVFRPFHDLLASYLRGEPSHEELLPNAVTTAAWHQHAQRVETAITHALLQTLEKDPGNRFIWESAHPYLRSYLAHHALAAGPSTFRSVITEMDYLAVAEPTTLVPLLTDSELALHPLARAYRRVRPFLGSNACDNAAFLQEAVVTETGSPPTSQNIRPTYRTLMVRVARDDSLFTLPAQGHGPNSVAFGTQPDGNPMLASGGWDGTIRLWNPLTGTSLDQFDTGRRNPVLTVAFGTQPDGNLILASGGWDGTVRLWNPLTGTSLGEPLTGHTEYVLSVAFGTNPDGNPILASAGNDCTVRLWDPLAGTPLCQPLTGHKATVASVAFGTNPDGTPILASADNDGTVRLWDPLTGASLGEPLIYPVTESVLSPSARSTLPLAQIVFGTSPHGNLLLACSHRSTGQIMLWDPLTGSALVQPNTTWHGPMAFGIGRDDEPVMAAVTDGIFMHDALQLSIPLAGVPLNRPLTGHSDSVTSVAFGKGPDGNLLLASSSHDGTLRLWDATRSLSPTPLLVGSPTSTPELTASDRPTLIALGTGPGSHVLLATAVMGGDVQIWDPVAGELLGKPIKIEGPEDLDVPAFFPSVVSLSALTLGNRPDGSPLLAGAGEDAAIQLWDPLAGIPLGKLLTGHTDGITCMAFGSRMDGTPLLASGGHDGTIRLWDPLTGTSLNEPIQGFSDPILEWVHSLDFGTTSDGTPILASGGDDGMVLIWDPLTGTLLNSLSGYQPFPDDSRPWIAGYTESVKSVAFGTGRDGEPLLASAGGDGTVRVFDPLAGALLSQPHTGRYGEVGRVTSLAFGTDSDDNPILAWQDRSVIHIWDPLTGMVHATLPRRTEVRQFAMQGTRLAVADKEGLYVFDLPTAGNKAR